MFIKIIAGDQVNGNPKKREWVFEADAISHTRHTIRSLDDQRTILQGWNPLPEHPPFEIGFPWGEPVSSERVNDNLVFDGFDCMEMFLYSGADPVNTRRVVLRDASVYIMNDSGQTVDTIHCFTVRACKD